MRLKKTSYLAIPTLALLLSLSGMSAAQTAPLIPTISCKSNPLSFNTGYDQDTGQLLANGSQDLQWWVSSTQSDPSGSIGPGSTATWKPTSVPYAANISPAWVSATALGNETNWVSPDPTGVTYTRPPYSYPYTPAVTNYYRMQFNLSPEVPPSALKLNMDYYNDDGMLGVFINNSFQTLPAAGFGAGTAATAQLNGPWVTGLNTVIFSMTDFGWASGLLAHIRSAASPCSESPLEITKSVSKPIFVPGEVATYTITVSNLGTLDVTGATLADPSPSGLLNGSWTCSTSGGATCPAALGSAPIGFDLVAGGQLIFTLSGTVAESGSLTNTATIAPGMGGVCAASTGCSATATASINPVPNLAPTWTIAPTSLAIGQTAQYQVTVTNNGGLGSTDGQLTITLPAGMVFTPAQTAPANCSISVASMVCTLSALTALGGTTSVSFNAQANAVFSAQNMTAQVSQVTGELVLSDNVASTPVASFAAPIKTAEPVPSLQEWGLVALSFILAMLGVHRNRRQS